VLALKFEDTFGEDDILAVSAVTIPSSILTGVGLIAGMLTAAHPARLHPMLAIRSEQGITGLQ